jgi:galactoside O-acetyltransferase
MTMRERIASGKLFTDYVEGLPEDREQAKRRMIAFNATSPDTLDERFRLMTEIFGRETKAWIEPPFYFCYGYNIEIGEGCYINFNCNFVDDGKIIIGNKVMFGPSVTIATVGHPLNPNYREYMYCDPVVIEDNCWIGASVVITPGVTIGENSVIGAGSVVTKDIPANSIAVGNPCKVLRTINEYDMKVYYKDREITQEDLDEEARLR